MNWKRSMAAVALVAVVAPIDAASAYEDAENGKALAMQWCASCHLVTPGQTEANADAPPFASIARRSEEELGRLPFFLTDPHPKMPNFNLTRQEIADLVAYIRSLKL